MRDDVAELLQVELAKPAEERVGSFAIDLERIEHGHCTPPPPTGGPTAGDGAVQQLRQRVGQDARFGGTRLGDGHEPLAQLA
ncbi:MAG TPA: hypothetical protein VEX36_09340 [Thermoleophilaceae bacterium]|nr:hypothetical protein [Thermoleophilaceae bacterium]